MEINSRGQVRRTEEEWRGILDRWEKSGLRALEFCKGEKIGHSTFVRWQSRLRGRSESRRRQEFVPLVAMAPTLPSRESWMVEVDLPNGVKLRFQG